MWNPFRISSAEARKLQQELDDLSDLYTVLSERFTRWDARQRGRARKQLDDMGADRPRDNGGCADPDSELSGKPVVAVDNTEDRDAVREQLRANARARGLMR